jgi:hypothetical protein
MYLELAAEVDAVAWAAHAAPAAWCDSFALEL